MTSTSQVMHLSEQQREQIAAILARAIKRTLDKSAAKRTQDNAKHPNKPEAVDES